MIISKYIKIKKPNGSKYKYYKDLGYDLEADEISVKIEDLTKFSRYKVHVECDYCGLKKDIPYCDYFKTTSNDQKYACSNCSKLKYEENCLKKYGVRNVFQLDEIKNKIRETSISKYGMYHTKTEETKSKIKKTVLDRYGVENISQLEDTKNKVKKTNLEKFGSEFIFNSEKYRSNNKIDSDINQISYMGDSIHLFNCDEGHTFEISNSNYNSRKRCNTPLCTFCNPIGENRSIKEKALFNYIKSIYSGEVIKGYKDVFEIDIYILNLKLGFEFNGLYYHSDKFKDKNYHLNKTNYFNNKEIDIFHIWEDDWDFRQNIVKSMIKNKLGLTENKIFARQCEVREINDTTSCISFLDDNHIQGYVNSSLKIGLYYNEELVSIMTFDKFEGRKKMKEGDWNLNGFYSKINTIIIGGFSKLLKYFIINYNPNLIISYADRSWSNGNLYKKIGFKELYLTNEDYKYIVGDKRVHKSRYRKSKTGISESNINLPKIYDCGKIKYIFYIKSSV